jgi:5'-nucleotidase/UDP-sugar diphosphatase
MKKLLSLFLVLALAFSLCVGVLAEEEAAPADIVVLYTNDVHCGIDGDFGYSNLVAYEKEMAAAGNYVTLVDAGDAIQGGPYGSLTDGQAIVDIMNKAGYDVATMGNHEFDYKMDRFLEIAKELDCGYVSCNFIDLRTNEPVFDAYKMITYGDVQVAYVGINTPETYTKSTPVYFQDENGNYIYSFSENDLAGAVQKAIDSAVEAGADYVIAVGHLGTDAESAPYRSTDIIAKVKGLDAFIDGHSHSVIASQEVKDAAGETVLLTSTGTKFANFGKLTISADGKITTELINSYEKTDADMDAFLKDIFTEFDGILKEVVAKSSVNLTGYAEDGTRLVRNQETNIGDLCADAYRAMADADIAWVNGGGIRADIPAGDITYGQIIDVHPYGNMLYVVEATGQQIIDALEMASASAPGENGGFLQVSGISYTIDLSIPSSVVTDDQGMFVKVDGERRVTDVMVGGEPIDLKATYTLASHDYMLRDGGDGINMFMDLEPISEGTMADNEVLISYITETLNGVVPDDYAKPQGRITIKEADAPVFTDVVEGKWYYDAVMAAYEQELMNGVTANTFEPMTAMNRAMLVTMLYRLEGSPEVEGNVSEVFADCKDTAYYAKAVLWASQNNIVSGRGESAFAPLATMTRQEMAVILYNYSVFKGAAEVTEPELAYADADAVASWATAAVAYCGESGLMTGVTDTEFAPAGSANRAMGATVLVRLVEAAA